MSGPVYSAARAAKTTPPTATAQKESLDAPLVETCAGPVASGAASVTGVDLPPVAPLTLTKLVGTTLTDTPEVALGLTLDQVTVLEDATVEDDLAAALDEACA